jgi:hypothetical protein
MSNLSEEIAKAAYELYEKRGMADGNALADWLKAEQMVRERMTAKNKKESAIAIKLESEKKKSKKTFTA